MVYTPTTYINSTTPALSATNLNKTEKALEAAAAGSVVVTHPDYGAIPNINDAPTRAINDAAFAAAAATGKLVLVPIGTFYCNNPSLDPTAGPRFQGSFLGDSWISMATAGAYLIDGNRQWESLYVCNLSFTGGAGAIRNRYTSANVTVRHRVLDCHFYDYTGAAISHNSTDYPFWDIQRCIFRGANDTTTIGVAIRGSDGSSIRDCTFQKDRIHIKIGPSTGNVHISNADFVQDGAASGGNTRVALWIVPSTNKVISGNGCSVEGSKFGNEQLGADDRRVVFADEGAGTYFGDRLPSLAADSTGYVNGFSISESLVVGNGTGPHPMIYSTTPFVEGCTVSNIKLLGNQPSYVLQLRTTTTSPVSDALSNIFGPIQYVDNNWVPFPPSNQLGVAYLLDPFGILRTDTEHMQVIGGGRSTGYVNLLQQRTTGFSVGGTTTKANITDSIGGADAVEVTYGTGGLFCGVPTSSVDVTKPAWLEFDCMVGSSSPVAQILVAVKLDSAGTGAGNYLRKTVTPPTTWRTYRVPIYIPLTSNNIIIDITPVSGTGKVKVGRIRMYHAQEPVLSELELRNVVTGTSALSAGGVTVPNALAWVEVNINGVTRKMVYWA